MNEKLAMKKAGSITKEYAIREACIKANPEITNGFPQKHFTGKSRPIRLADVLLAIAERDLRFLDNTHLVLGRGKMCLRTGKDVYWNLLKDDLREQSEETIDFLFNLLK